MPAKKKAAAKKTDKPNEFLLKLSGNELEHMRNVFSVILPNEEGNSLSEALARLTQPEADGLAMESALWAKIEDLCFGADIPVGDDAPDFAVVQSGPAPLGIFLLDSDQEQPAEK